MVPNFLSSKNTQSRLPRLVSYFHGLIVLSVVILVIGLFRMDRLFQPAAMFVDSIRPFAVPQTETAYGGDVFITPPVPEPPPPPLPTLTTEPFDTETLSAASVIVKDADTGFVYVKKNEYTPHAMASITKLMSALVLLETNINWTATTTVVTGELVDTHMYAGDTYTLEELWYSGLVASSNKAIMTLASVQGWSPEAFVVRMNEKAQELGMGDTYFVEPTGLDAGNRSTASDIALLLEEALKQEKIQAALLTKDYTIFSEERNKTHEMWNTNWLLLGWVPQEFATFHGGKTGYISASGYNFTMQVSDEAGHRLSVVVLGANAHEARFTEARDIANWVFDSFTWVN